MIPQIYLKISGLLLTCDIGTPIITYISSKTPTQPEMSMNAQAAKQANDVRLAAARREYEFCQRMPQQYRIAARLADAHRELRSALAACKAST